MIGRVQVIRPSGRSSLLRRFLQAALCCLAGADPAWQNEAAGMLASPPKESVNTSRQASKASNVTALEQQLRDSEAKAVVAQELEEQEKELLIKTIARAKEAEVIVQREKKEIASESKEAQQAIQRQQELEEKLRKALASLRQSHEHGQMVEKKEQADLARAKSLEEEVTEVRKQLELEKRNSSRAIANASEEGLKAYRLRQEVLKLAQELATAKKDVASAKKKGETAGERLNKEEHEAHLALVNQTQETLAAKKEAERAEGATQKALKELRTMELALKHARSQRYAAEENATKLMKEESMVEKELRRGRIQARADAQHMQSAEANASQEHRAADLAQKALDKERQQFQKAKSQLDRANSIARTSAKLEQAAKEKEQETEKQLSIEQQRFEAENQTAHQLMFNTTRLKKELEQTLNASKHEATRNHALAELLRGAHAAVAKAESDAEKAKNRSVQLEEKANTTAKWAKLAVANATDAASKALAGKRQAMASMAKLKQDVRTARSDVHKEEEAAKRREEEDRREAALANSTVASLRDDVKADKHHMKLAFSNISILRREVQDLQGNLTASRREAAANERAAEMKAKHVQVLADNAAKEKQEALAAEHEAHEAEDKQKTMFKRYVTLNKSVKRLEEELLKAERVGTKANQSEEIAEKHLSKEEKKEAHLNQSIVFMTKRLEMEAQQLRAAHEQAKEAGKEADLEKQKRQKVEKQFTKQEDIERHRVEQLQKQLSVATVALQTAHAKEHGAEDQIRSLNATIAKGMARLKAETRGEKASEENATKLAESLESVRKQNTNLTRQVKAGRAAQRDLETSKDKVIEDGEKEVKELKDKEERQDQLTKKLQHQLSVSRQQEAADQKAAKNAQQAEHREDSELHAAEAHAQRAAELVEQVLQGHPGHKGQNATGVATTAEVVNLTGALLQLRGKEREAEKEKDLAQKEMAREKDREKAAELNQTKALKAMRSKERSARTALANATSETQGREQQIISLQRSLHSAKEREAELLPLLLCLVCVLLAFALTVCFLRRHFLAQRAQQFETILRLSVERLKALKMLEDATVPLLSNNGSSTPAKDKLADP